MFLKCFILLGEHFAWWLWSWMSLWRTAAWKWHVGWDQSGLLCPWESSSTSTWKPPPNLCRVSCITDPYWLNPELQLCVCLWCSVCVSAQNPAPGLQNYKTYKYLECDLDFHLCPMPRSLMFAFNKAKLLFTDREADALRGILFCVCRYKTPESRMKTSHTEKNFLDHEVTDDLRLTSQHKSLSYFASWRFFFSNADSDASSHFFSNNSYGPERRTWWISVCSRDQNSALSVSHAGKVTWHLT